MNHFCRSIVLGFILFSLVASSSGRTTTIDLNLFAKRAQMQFLVGLDEDTFARIDFSKALIIFQETIHQTVSKIVGVSDRTGIYYIVPFAGLSSLGKNIFLSYSMHYDGRNTLSLVHFDGLSVVELNMRSFHLKLIPTNALEQWERFEFDLIQEFPGLKTFILENLEEPSLVFSFQCDPVTSSFESQHIHVSHILLWLASQQSRWVPDSLELAPVRGLPARFRGKAIELVVSTGPVSLNGYRSQSALELLKTFKLPLHPDLEDLSCDGALKSQ